MLTSQTAYTPPSTKPHRTPPRPVLPSAGKQSTRYDETAASKQVHGSLEEHQTISTHDAEERYWLKSITILFVAMALAALTLMTYFIFFIPDSFQYDITPQRDFSTWHPGQSS